MNFSMLFPRSGYKHYQTLSEHATRPILPRGQSSYPVMRQVALMSQSSHVKSDIITTGTIAESGITHI